MTEISADCFSCHLISVLADQEELQSGLKTPQFGSTVAMCFKPLSKG